VSGPAAPRGAQERVREVHHNALGGGSPCSAECSGIARLVAAESCCYAGGLFAGPREREGSSNGLRQPSQRSTSSTRAAAGRVRRVAPYQWELRPMLSSRQTKGTVAWLTGAYLDVARAASLRRPWYHFLAWLSEREAQRHTDYPAWGWSSSTAAKVALALRGAFKRGSRSTSFETSDSWRSAVLSCQEPGTTFTGAPPRADLGQRACPKSSGARPPLSRRRRQRLPLSPNQLTSTFPEVVGEEKNVTVH